MYLPFLLRKGSMVSTTFGFRVISRWSEVSTYSCRSSPGWLNRLPFALHLVRRFAFPLPQVPLSRGLSKDGAKVGLVVSSSVRHFSSIYLRDRLSSEDLLKGRATTCIIQQEGTPLRWFSSVSNEKGWSWLFCLTNPSFLSLSSFVFVVL